VPRSVIVAGQAGAPVAGMAAPGSR
jgi:hypothetical protein